MHVAQLYSDYYFCVVGGSIRVVLLADAIRAGEERRVGGIHPVKEVVEGCCRGCRVHVVDTIVE